MAKNDQKPLELWMTPATKQGPRSYNHRQLHSANNELEGESWWKCSPGQHLDSALWFQPEKRIQLPHDHTSDLQKLEANRWCYFKPLNLCDLLHNNRKLIFAFAWQSPGCSSKLNAKGFEEMSFLVCHPLKFSMRSGAWCWCCMNQSLISATPSVGNSFLICLS